MRVIHLSVLILNCTNFDSEQNPEESLRDSHRSSPITKLSTDSDESDESETIGFSRTRRGRISSNRRRSVSQPRRQEAKETTSMPIQWESSDDSDRDTLQSSRRRASKSVFGETSSYHRDYEIIIDRPMLEKSDGYQAIDIRKQQLEIERLERHLQRADQRISQPREVSLMACQIPCCGSCPLENEEQLDEEGSHYHLHRMQRYKRIAWSEGEQEQLKTQKITRENHKTVDKACEDKQDLAMGESAAQESEQEQKSIRKKKRAHRRHSSTDTSSSEQSHAPDRLLQRRSSLSQQPLRRRSLSLTESEKDEQKYVTIDPPERADLQNVAAPEGISKPPRPSFPVDPKPVSESESLNDHQKTRPMSGTTSQQKSPSDQHGDDALYQTFSEHLSLPGSLEDFLTQWTTLDKQEIQRGQLVTI